MRVSFLINPKKTGYLLLTEGCMCGPFVTTGYSSSGGPSGPLSHSFLHYTFSLVTVCLVIYPCAETPHEVYYGASVG